MLVFKEENFRQNTWNCQGAHNLFQAGGPTLGSMLLLPSWKFLIIF